LKAFRRSQVRNYNPPQLPKSPGLGRLSPDVFVSARGTVAIPLTAVSSDAQLLPCESTTSITDTGGVSATAAAITIDNPSSTYKGLRPCAAAPILPRAPAM